MYRAPELGSTSRPLADDPHGGDSRNWYAVFTAPQHEKSAVRHLELREIDSFLPTYESERVWKNRQRMKLRIPLFPSYLFVRISAAERSHVLRSPGVLQIVGNGREPLAIPDKEIGFLRSDLHKAGIEPHDDFVVGTSVRIKSGPFQGVRGTLVRRNNHDRFVLTIRLINRHAAIDVAAENLEAVPAGIQ